MFCVYEALKRGIDHETIWKITKIDWWFLDKMQHLADLEKGLAKCNGVLSLEQYQTAKKYGFQEMANIHRLEVCLRRASKRIQLAGMSLHDILPVHLSISLFFDLVFLRC